MKLQDAVGKLVLSRKQGESVDVDGIVRVTVTRAKGNVVSLLFEAPRDISIKRSELADRNDATARTA